MENSKALGFVWKIALLEAVGTQNKEVFPEHFMCALLKFVELDQAAIEISIPDDVKDIDGILAEKEQIRKVFTSMGIDTTSARHSLREKVPKGEMEKITRVIRRSTKSREIFTRASEEAQQQSSSFLRCHHLLLTLLQNPTDMIRDVLNLEQVDLGMLVATDDTPVLNQFGHNIIEDLKGEVLSIPPIREPHANALIRVMKAKDFSPLLLIEEGEGEAYGVVQAAAFLLKDDLFSSVILVDYSDLQAAFTEPEALCHQLDLMHAEIANLEDRVVFLHHFDAGLLESEVLCECFMNNFAQTHGRWLVGITKATYQAVFEQTRAKNAFRLMWIHKLEEGELPQEL